MNEMDEEKYRYDGPGALPDADPDGEAPLSVVLFHVDAVLPPMSVNPMLTRIEYDLAERLGGWERLSGGAWGLRGWRRRVGEKCRGFGASLVFGPRSDEDRMLVVKSAIDYYFPAGRTGYSYIGGDADDWPCDRIAFGVLSAVDLVRGHSPVREVTVYLPGTPDTPDLVADVERCLAWRDPAIAVDLRPAHPSLGLLSDRLPLTGELARLDRQLEHRVPAILNARSLSADAGTLPTGGLT